VVDFRIELKGSRRNGFQFNVQLQPGMKAGYRMPRKPSTNSPKPLHWLPNDLIQPIQNGYIHIGTELLPNRNLETLPKRKGKVPNRDSLVR
jgi:hypothetical protein